MLVSKKGTVDGRDPANQLIGSLSHYQQYQSHVLLVNTETSFPTIRFTSLDSWILHRRKDVWNHIPTIKSICLYTPTCSYQPTVLRFANCQHMSCHVPFSVPKSEKPQVHTYHWDQKRWYFKVLVHSHHILSSTPATIQKFKTAMQFH